MQEIKNNLGLPSNSLWDVCFPSCDLVPSSVSGRKPALSIWAVCQAVGESVSLSLSVRLSTSPDRYIFCIVIPPFPKVAHLENNWAGHLAPKRMFSPRHIASKERTEEMMADVWWETSAGFLSKTCFKGLGPKCLEGKDLFFWALRTP